jgi:hypothetical protein
METQFTIADIKESNINNSHLSRKSYQPLIQKPFRKIAKAAKVITKMKNAMNTRIRSTNKSKTMDLRRSQDFWNIDLTRVHKETQDFFSKVYYDGFYKGKSELTTPPDK